MSVRGVALERSPGVRVGRSPEDPVHLDGMRILGRGIPGNLRRVRIDDLHAHILRRPGQLIALLVEAAHDGLRLRQHAVLVVHQRLSSAPIETPPRNA